MGSMRQYAAKSLQSCPTLRDCMRQYSQRCLDSVYDLVDAKLMAGLIATATQRFSLPWATMFVRMIFLLKSCHAPGKWAVFVIAKSWSTGL